MSYMPLELASKKLNILESEILAYRAIGHIRYSERTNKYNIDSVLEQRTLTLPLYKYLSDEQTSFILSYMKDYSKLKFKIFNDLQKQKAEYKNEGSNRLHRELAKKINGSFTSNIADSALSAANGILKSSNTWRVKSIKNLEDRITTIESELSDMTSNKKQEKFHSNFTKGKRKKLAYLKNRLAKFQSKEYLPVQFGKSALKNNIELSTEQIKENYKLARLEFFIEGSASNNGNSLIRIEHNKSSKLPYRLRFFGKVIADLDIPNSHKDTFSLAHFNRQSCRVSFNSKNKMVLHVTYSYIKPLAIMSHRSSKGILGIDIGPKEIAVCYVKNDGNPFLYKHYNIGNLLDSRNKDKQRQLSIILDEIIDEGTKEGYYKIAIENLEFRMNHKYRSRQLNRMLSKFPHQIFEDLIISKTKRKGVTLKRINPAYTSTIGIFKYSNRDNLATNHNANSKDLSASLVIGRRALGFNEKAVVCVRVSKSTVSMPISSLLVESEKDTSKCKLEKKGNWSLWNKIAKQCKSYNGLTARIVEIMSNQNQTSSNTCKLDDFIIPMSTRDSGQVSKDILEHC